MPSIDKYEFSAWAGKMPIPETSYETFRRPGLDALGVGFDSQIVEPATIMTRAIVAADQLDGTAAGYRALVQRTVAVVDGMGRKHKTVLVVRVRGIVWDQLIAPAGSYLVSAEWALLPEITAPVPVTP